MPVFFCAPIFCDTWSWTGGTSNDNWAYGPPWRNETTGEEGTIFTGHPDGTEDIAYISGDCEIELKGPLAEYDITLNELRFQTYTGAAYKTSSWTATIKGNKTLTFNLMELDRAATLEGVTGTLEFNCPTVCKGKIITHSDTTFTATKPITLAADSEITAIGNGAITISELVGTKTATLFCGTDDYMEISAYDTTDVPSIVVAANSKSVSLGGGTIAGLTVNSNAAATVTSGMTVDGDLVVDGELTIAGDLTVTGTLTVTESGKLTVNGDLNVTGDTKNEGTITTNAGAAFSSLLIDGGSLVNTGSGAVTATTFTIGSHDASVTNSSTGSITVGTLTGAYKANLDNSSSGSITVSDYGAGANAPKIVLAASSQNVSLAGGTIAALTLGSSAQAGITGNLTVTGATSNAGTITATGAITFNGAVAGASGTITSANITVDAAGNSNLGTVQMTANSSITNSGAGSTTITKLAGAQAATLSASTGSMTVSSYDATNVPSVTVASDNVSLGAGTVAALTVNASAEAVVAGDLTATGGVTNNGTLTSSAKITMTGASASFGGTGSATIADFAYAPAATSGTGLAVAGDNTFTNFTCSTDGAKITISGNNSFTTLTVKSAGGTLSINGAQTVGTLDLEGKTGAGNLLNVNGSGSVTLPSTQSSGQYLSVAHGGVSILPSAYYYNAADSSFTTAPVYGADNNWIILNPLMEFVWTGANGTDWGTASNWNYNLVPGLAAATGGVDTRNYPVTIPAVTNYPDMPDATNYSVSDLTIDAAAASLTLSSTGNVTASGTLTNKGTIVYSNTGRVTDGTAFINDSANGGTVEFAGASGAADLSTPTAGYYNLTINGSGTYTAAAALNVTNALTVSDGNANFNGATSVKTASITTTGSLTLGDGAGDSFTVTNGALVLPSTIATSPAALTLAGTITASGGISLAHDATLAANTTFASATTIDALVKLTGAFTVENTAALTTTLTNTLTLVNASLKNTGAAANGYIVFEGTAAQTFTPDAASTYQSVTVNKTSGNFTASQALKAANLSITQCAGATFSGLVTVSTAYADATTAGSIAFNAGCAFTPATTFLTNGTVTLNGTSDACAFTAGLEHTAGDTAISGDLTTTNAAIKLGATTLAADTTINAGSGAVTFQGTLNGAFALASNGSGALTFGGAVGTPNALAAITVTGPAIVTAPTIRTSGAQEYKDNLTFDANCDVTGTVKMTGAAATLGGTGKATIADFAYAPTAASGTNLTINNDNSFAKFSCTKGGATLTINGAQTITGTGTGAATTPLELKGANGNHLTITGSGSVTLSAAQESSQYGQYLKVTRGGVSIDSTHYYIAENSEFDSAPLYGEHNNWIILNPLMEFVWTGATSDAWGNRSNWNYNLIPGTGHGLTGDSSSVPVNTENYDVIIPDAPSGVATNFPVVTATQGYYVGSLNVGQSAASPASLTINTAGTTSPTDTGAIKIYTGKSLENYGKIIYSNTGRVTQSNVFYNDTAHNGTVVFDGTVAATDISAVEYYNLISSGPGNRTASTALTVLNDLTISGTGTFTANAAATITHALTASAGNVYFNNDAATNTATSAATAAFATTGNVSLGNTAGDNFKVTGGALTLPQTLGGLTLAGTITASGGITLGHDAALAANTTFASATSLGAPVNLTAATALTVTTNAALTTSAAAPLTLTNASLTNAAAVTGGNIIFAETTLKPHQVFTPNTASTYQSVTINKTSGGEFTVNQELNAADFIVTKNGTLTTSAAVNAINFTINDNNVYVANAAVTAASLAITKNGNATFYELATVTASYADTAAAGNITFAKGCAFTFASPATTFNTTGTLTLNGATNACAFTGGLTHTDGPTILSGDLTTTNAAITLGKTSPDITTTLAADTTINAGSGAVSINGTLNGAYIFTSSGSGALTFVGVVGGTTPPTQLTAAGPVEINAATKIDGPITINGQTTVTAASITTPIDSTGLQHYKDNLAFNSNCTVTGTVQAAANVATSGAAKATFNNNLWLYTNAGNAKDSTLGGGSATPSLDIKGNLYIAKTGQAATVVSAVSSAKNILLLHGTLNVNAALSSTQDIILLGASYGINDTNETTASQVAGLFAYKHASRKRAASYTDPFPTACPDGSSFGGSWTGAVAASAGTTVSAGQNFYANGLSITGSGAWTLLLKDNNKQTDAFAEIYNSTITNCSANHNVAAAENVTATNCVNVTTSRPVIFQADTVYDDVIHIAFKDSAGNSVTIENSGNEISAAAASIRNSAGGYASTYIDADCQTSTDGRGDIAGGFYIKSSNKWNTDAYGISAGAAQSSDRGSTGSLPTHRTTIPYLNLPKALTTLYETLRDSSKNRIAHYYSATPDTSAASSAAGKTFTAVADNCAPVLIKVLSGQEIHEPPASQKDCDAHNFVEFVYSEPVDISSVSGATSVAESAVNVQAAADLGNATGTAGITFAGLAATSSGKIEAALKSGSGSPHSLYRNFSASAGAAAANQAARIRVSIAGWVDGTVSGGYKNWAGYISSAATPSGTITRIANANIKDKSPAQNSLTTVSTTGHQLPTLSVQSSDGGTNELYGPWDATPPSFAPVRINGTTTWAPPVYDGSQEFEYVGASYGTGTLSAIEVHWFDNQPTYSENRQWFSRVGWADASSPTQYSTIVSYAADVRGGSRPDIGSAVTSANATTGGIRYCSLYNAYTAFKYSVVGSGTYNDFTQTIQGGAESSLFTYAGTATGTHTTGAEDGLYCKLRLDDTTLQPNTTFLMQFDSDACCVTDLAGNRIQCGNITMKSVDRTPPEYLMTAVPIGTKQMLIIFSKELNVDTLTLYDDATTHTDVSALDYIPQALELTGGSGTIAIDQSVPATCVFRNNKSTGIVVTLSQNAVLNDITGGILVNAIGVNKYDPLAGIPATITYIQDSIGNYLVPAKKHALSDFAVNAVNPQYAYDNTLTDGGVSTDYSLYQEGAWAVRDWNAEQGNYGTLSAAKEYIMQTTLYDGTNDNSGGAADFLGTSPTQKVTSFFDAAPDFGSVSTKINENTRLSWRIWHPNFTPAVFTSLATINNAPQYNLDGSANDSGVVFDIPESVSSAKWKSGDQVSFLFKMGNYTVDHFANGTAYPLYAVRLKDPNDITSLDLWSFKIKTTSLQRGGVSILNNVIDLNTGEHTVIQVDMKQSGNLNVIVMTLDGNIVTYLRHGQTDAGTHYYNWNGNNNGGSKVARGLYFVRVIGPGIDETRKVMCVK